jgi:hypothetical protein
MRIHPDRSRPTISMIRTILDGASTSTIGPQFADAAARRIAWSPLESMNVTPLRSSRTS